MLGSRCGVTTYTWMKVRLARSMRVLMTARLGEDCRRVGCVVVRVHADAARDQWVGSWGVPAPGCMAAWVHGVCAAGT